MQAKLPKNRAPKRPMEKIQDFRHGKLPKKDMKEFTKEVNLLIDQYNNEDQELNKIAILKEIENKAAQVNNIYPSSYIASSPEYNALQNALFKEIQYQYSTLGVFSLDKAPKPSSLSELIANMSPEKTSQLTKILLNSDKAMLMKEIGKLYEEDDVSEEALAFEDFLLNHEISFLGGGNSKNFKVTNILDNSVSVLKVDNRLNMPRNIAVYLQEKVRALFTVVDAERSVVCEDSNGNKIHRTLQVTELCANGSLLEHRESLKTVTELVRCTGTIFEQMARSMIDIQEAGCFFPDAKATNWLVDKNNQLYIADTKSFVFTDKDGNYRGGIPGNEYCNLLGTSGFMPPDTFFSPINADEHHAYILGKNLYFYASSSIGIGHDGSKFDFNKQLFLKPEGPEYRAIIEGLVKPDPSQRMSVREALDRLFMINNPEFKEVFTVLRKLKFGENDKIMNDYIREKQTQINKAETIEERLEILRELETTVTKLKADAASREVHAIVDKYRENAGLFTVGMNAKASRIEQEMQKLSVEERCNFFGTKKSEQVLKAVASHRHWGKSGKVYENEDKTIDESKAAQSYKDFRKQFNEVMDTSQEHHDEQVKDEMRSNNRK